MSYMVDGKDKRSNNRTMLPTLKNNVAAGYQGPVKVELLKGVHVGVLFLAHLDKS